MPLDSSNLGFIQAVFNIFISVLFFVVIWGFIKLVRSSNKSFLDKSEKKFQIAKEQPQSEFEGDLFVEFPNLSFTFNMASFFDERKLFMNLYKSEVVRNAREKKDESLLGKPLATAKLVAEIPNVGKDDYLDTANNFSVSPIAGILKAIDMSEKGLNPINYLSHITGNLALYSRKNKIKASFAYGKVEVKLDGGKAGYIDFKSMRMESFSNRAQWKIKQINEKTLFMEEPLLYRFEKSSNVFAETRAYPKEDTDDMSEYTILFSKYSGLEEISDEEKALLIVGAILAELNFWYNWRP